jgi:hypothetical protein
MDGGEAVAVKRTPLFEKHGNEVLRSLPAKGEMMKRRVFSIAFSCCVLTLLATVTAFAQLPGQPIRTNIPFDFSIRGRTLPAGEYEIRRVMDEPGTLEIASIRHSHQHAMFEVDPVETLHYPKHGEIVFVRYGDTYFLHEIWSAGLQTGAEVPRSHDERVLRREMASNGIDVQQETVALAVE